MSDLPQGTIQVVDAKVTKGQKMTDINSGFLSGTVVSEPDFKVVGQGLAIATFDVETLSAPNREGVSKKATIQVKAMGAVAGEVKSSVANGYRVVVQYRLNSWQGKPNAHGVAYNNVTVEATAVKVTSTGSMQPQARQAALPPRPHHTTQSAEEGCPF